MALSSRDLIVGLVGDVVGRRAFAVPSHPKLADMAVR